MLSNGLASCGSQCIPVQHSWSSILRCDWPCTEGWEAARSLFFFSFPELGASELHWGRLLGSFFMFSFSFPESDLSCSSWYVGMQLQVGHVCWTAALSLKAEKMSRPQPGTKTNINVEQMATLSATKLAIVIHFAGDYNIHGNMYKDLQ